MSDPITLMALAATIANNTPSWLKSLHETFLNKSEESLVDKSKAVIISGGARFVRNIFHIDEKEP